MAETIEAKVEERLKDMSLTNGYNYDYANVEAGEDLRILESLEQRNEFPVVFCPGGNEGPPGSETAPVTRDERRIEIDVFGYAKSKDHGTQLNKIRQDVERTLIRSDDAVPLGIVGVTTLNLVTVLKDQMPDNPDLEMIILTFAAQYRYTRGDP
jgi:hypothetical protein